MNYGVLAKYYDRMMGNREKELAGLKQLIETNSPEAKKILELACGTGTVSKYLHDQGYEMTGIDISPEMLAVARNKIPHATFFEQDIATFALSGTFDVVVCLFDSINHLIGYEKWEALFSRARNHLNNGGVFIFDINTIKKLGQLASGHPYIRVFDDTKISMVITRRSDGVYDWLTRFEDIKRGTAEEEIIQEQSFAIEKILGSLKLLFSDVVVSDYNTLPATETSDRVYFICRA